MGTMTERWAQYQRPGEKVPAEMMDSHLGHRKLPGAASALANYQGRPLAPDLPSFASCQAYRR
mgnify:CR=1 FL=1|jgi:hypothetical protein